MPIDDLDIGASKRMPRSRGCWIDDWRPEDLEFWTTTGERVARRNLIFSVLSEHIGFSVWALWSALVLFLGPEYHVNTAQKFILVSIPTAIGAVLRLPYTLAVATFGGRNWTVFSTVLLLVPTTATAIFVKPGVSYTALLILAGLTGVGGGNFASSMVNINAFYPQRLKGRALGLNAAGGNLGVATAQLAGLVVLAFAGRDHPRLVAGIFIPLIVFTALGAWLFMDNLCGMRNDTGALREVAKDAHTWSLSLLYLGTFGSFVGFSFAFGQVLQIQFGDQFATPADAARLTFLGPLLGSLARPAGGWLADRTGGARVTLCVFFAMGASSALVLVASRTTSLPLFLGGFSALFIFSGLGNGSAYKMIPTVFHAKAALMYTDRNTAETAARRLSGALIGIAGAVGAFGGLLIIVVFRQSFLAYRTGDTAYIAFIGLYGLCAIVTWAIYVWPSSPRYPRRLVHASIVPLRRASVRNTIGGTRNE